MPLPAPGREGTGRHVSEQRRTFRVMKRLLCPALVAICVSSVAMLRLAASDSAPDTSGVAVAPAERTKPATPEWIGFGERVNLEDYLVAGKMVMFVFLSSCDPNEMLEPRLDKYHADTPGVVVYKVDIDRPNRQLRRPNPSSFNTDWHSPLAEQFNITGVPACIIYGTDGKLLAQGDTAEKWLWEWTE